MGPWAPVIPVEKVPLQAGGDIPILSKFDRIMRTACPGNDFRSRVALHLCRAAPAAPWASVSVHHEFAVNEAVFLMRFASFGRRSPDARRRIGVARPRREFLAS